MKAASFLLLVAIALLLSSLATTNGAVADNIESSPRATTCRRGELPTKLAMVCWKAIFEVPFCVFEIVKVYEGGSVFDIGKPCCRAFVDLSDDCRIEVFQHSKFFPVIEGFCKAVIGAGPIGGGSGVVRAPPPHHHHHHSG
ncbi:unnamed protein product [Linum tenue]|uniref:Prolamin-like domain-containing protein n=1 Tax=Linum tenue TaxID=586396 RepID=A0AAV0N1A8_9ROSI|nr:unnamed protein product [Linum tenue]